MGGQWHVYADQRNQLMSRLHTPHYNGTINIMLGNLSPTVFQQSTWNNRNCESLDNATRCESCTLQSPGWVLRGVAACANRDTLMPLLSFYPKEIKGQWNMLFVMRFIPQELNGNMRWINVGCRLGKSSNTTLYTISTNSEGRWYRLASVIVGSHFRSRHFKYLHNCRYAIPSVWHCKHAPFKIR